MVRDTGFPTSDAQDDFLRARRRRALARLSAALRLEYDVDVMLPFDEVVEALGRAGERDVGIQTIPLDSIVGSVDRHKDFDRQFRPTSSKVRKTIAMSRSRGERLLTTRSPISSSPSEMSSRPAIMRSAVDFPQPDGPTRIMNSPSSMSRLMCLTASVPSA